MPFRYNPILTYGKRLEDSYIHLGKSLEPFSGSNTWMVTGEAGSIPYFSGWNNLDPIGLGTRLKKSGDLNETFTNISPSLIFFYEDKDGILEIKPGKTIKGKSKGLCWAFSEEEIKKYEAGTLELDLYEYEVSK